MTTNFPTFYPLNAGQIGAAVSHFLTLLTVNASPELVRAALQEQLHNWHHVIARVESFQEWELQRFGVSSTENVKPKKGRPTLAELLVRNADDCDGDPRDCPCDWHGYRREVEEQRERAAEQLPPSKRPFTEEELRTAAMEYCASLPEADRQLLGFKTVERPRREPIAKRDVVLLPEHLDHVREELHKLARSISLPTVSLEVQPSAYSGAIFARWTSHGASNQYEQHIWIDPNGPDLGEVLRMFVARCAVASGAFNEEQAQRFVDTGLAEHIGLADAVAQIRVMTRERALQRYRDVVQLEEYAKNELSTPPPAAPVERRRTLASIVERCSTTAGLFELYAMQLWARDRRGIEIKLRELTDPDMLDHLEGKAAWIVDFKLDSGAVISNGHPLRWWTAFAELASRVERLEDARGVLLHEDLGRHPPEPLQGQAISTERGRSEASAGDEQRSHRSPADGLEREGAPDVPSPTERSRGQAASAAGERDGQGSAGVPAGGVS